MQATHKSIATLVGVGLGLLQTHGASFSFIDFTGINYGALPQSFAYAGGSVTVSLLTSPQAQPAGIWGGAENNHTGPEQWNSSVGDLYMALLGTEPTAGGDEFSIRLSFSAPVNVAMTQTETYNAGEFTTFLTVGSVWSGSFFLNPGSGIAAGLGTSTLTLSGDAVGIGAWGGRPWDQVFAYGTFRADAVSHLDVTYGTGHYTTGNGFELAVAAVPEPHSSAIFTGAGLVGFCICRRLGRKDSV